MVERSRTQEVGFRGVSSLIAGDTSGTRRCGVDVAVLFREGPVGIVASGVLKR
jgi:hypothetical protein